MTDHPSAGRPQMRLALSLTALVLAIFLFAGAGLHGCGGEDLLVPGSLPPTRTPQTETPTPTCKDPGERCTFGSDCCSEECFIGICQ